MKYLFLITAFISLNLSLNITESTYTKNTIVNAPPSLAEQYYDKLEVKTNLPKMLNKFLDRKALTRTEVPASLWLEIKNSIDYATFKTQIVEIIPDYYSDSELLSITLNYSDRPKAPITKLEFRRALAEKIDLFIDLEFTPKVNTMLSENGYSSL